MAPTAIILDSGALTALAEDEEAVRVVIRKALVDDIDVFVPTIVIAESTTGNPGRDANVNRYLAAVTTLDLTESIARAAARLRALVKGSGIADAVVAATADHVTGSTILTGDEDDLRLLCSVNRRSSIIPISGGRRRQGRKRS